MALAAAFATSLSAAVAERRSASTGAMRWVVLDPSAETVTDSRPILITVKRLATVSPSAPARISLPSRKIAYLALPPVGVVFSTKPAYFTSDLVLGRGAGRGAVLGAGGRVCDVLVGGGGRAALRVDRGSGMKRFRPCPSYSGTGDSMACKSSSESMGGAARPPRRGARRSDGSVLGAGSEAQP